MKMRIIALFTGVLIAFPFNSFAQQTIGQISGVIDGEQIDVQVRCEYADPPGLLSSRSDWESNMQSDTDGDGIFITVAGMKSIGRVAVIFHSGEKIYKFGQKGDFDQAGLVINDEFNRKDGSTYNVNLKLECN